MFKKELNFEKFSNYVCLILKTYENDSERNSHSYKQLFEDLNVDQQELKNICCLHFKNCQPDDLYNIYSTKSLSEILLDDKNLDNLLYSNFINFLDLFLYSLLTCKEDKSDPYSIAKRFKKRLFFFDIFPVIFLVHHIITPFSTRCIGSIETRENYYAEVFGANIKKRGKDLNYEEYLRHMKINIDSIESNDSCQRQLAEVIDRRFFNICRFLKKDGHEKFLKNNPDFSVEIAENCMRFWDIMIRLTNFSNYVFDSAPKSIEFIFEYIEMLWDNCGVHKHNFFIGNFMEDLSKIPKDFVHLTETKQYSTKKLLLFSIYLWIFLISENYQLRKCVVNEIISDAVLFIYGLESDSDFKAMEE